MSVGTQKAVKLVAQPGGYLDNQAIKILLPQSLRPVEKGLRAAGQGPKIDDFVASMNHAAESAAPEAEKIFAGAVREMTIDDARKAAERRRYVHYGVLQVEDLEPSLRRHFVRMSRRR